MPLCGGALIQRAIFNEGPGPKAAGQAREGPLAVKGQRQQLGDAPIARQGEMSHRLAQLGFFARMLDQIKLVDDIHEIVQLGHAPEDLVHAQAKLPEIFSPFPVGQQVGLAHIGVAAARIGAVVSIKRGEGEADPFRKVPVKRRLENDAPAAGALLREGRRFREPSALKAEIARPLQGLRHRHRGRHEQKGRNGAAEAHQRTRRSAVWVNSLSSRLLRKRKSLHSRTVLLPVRWFDIVISPARQNSSRWS